MIKIERQIKPPTRIHVRRKAMFDALEIGETLFEPGEGLNLKAYTSRYQKNSSYKTFITWINEEAGVKGRFVQRTT